jgi:hypothetical protein
LIPARKRPPRVWEAASAGEPLHLEPACATHGIRHACLSASLARKPWPSAGWSEHDTYVASERQLHVPKATRDSQCTDQRQHQQALAAHMYVQQQAGTGRINDRQHGACMGPGSCTHRHHGVFGMHPCMTTLCVLHFRRGEGAWNNRVKRQ